MKRCPTCNRTYTDPTLSFCIDDGTPLAPVTDNEETVVRPSASGRGTDTQENINSNWTTPAYVPPGTNIPGGEKKKRRVWPWVLGIFGVALVALVGMGVVAALVIPNLLRSQQSNRRVIVENSNRVSNLNIELNRNSNVNANVNTNANANSNANALPNTNGPADDEDSAPPTDEAEVLDDLSALEDDWTLANINADKEALGRILADDYVSTSGDRTIGKAEYIATIERDTNIQRWKFEDLKVQLSGNRAILTGRVTFITREGPVVYRFTDRFVWRDGRWQATGSEISRLESRSR